MKKLKKTEEERIPKGGAKEGYLKNSPKEQQK